MNGLILHCGASRVERTEVFEAKTPEPEGSHYPIPHALLLEELEKNLETNGFTIEEEAHALTRGGARYFGLIRVSKKAAVPCMDEPAPAGAPEGFYKVETEQTDFGLVIGLRNTHDRSWAAALVMGNHVFCCDNLAFSGEVLVGRKHTRNIARDLPRLIPRAFGALGAERVRMEERVEWYKKTEIDNRRAHDIIVRSIVDEKVFPASNLPAIVNEWRASKHEEFQPRTIWSLSNAYTEVAKPAEGKPGNVQLLTRRTQNLYGFLDKELGLSLEAKLAEGLDDVVTANDAFGN